MYKNLFRLAEIIWIICALSPLAVFAVQKIKKRMKIKMFAIGFGLYLIFRIAVLFDVAAPFLLPVITVVLLIFLFGFFSCFDGYSAAAAALGIAQCSLTVLAISAIASLEALMNYTSTSCYTDYDAFGYYNFSMFMISAAVKTVAVFASAFALKRLCSSPKMRGVKAGLLGVLTVAAAEMLPSLFIKLILYIF